MSGVIDALIRAAAAADLRPKRRRGRDLPTDNEESQGDAVAARPRVTRTETLSR
jgi:hypothetical protein